MRSLRFLMLLCAAGALASSAPVDGSDGDDAKTEGCTSVFVATEEFRTVEPWECLPKGLHVRINMQTGQKEAKLYVPDHEEEAGVLVIPSTESQEQDVEEEEDNEEEGKAKISYLKQENEEKGEGSIAGIPPKLRDEILEALVGKGQDTNIHAFKNETSTPHTPVDFKISYTLTGSDDDIVTGLIGLEDIVGDFGDGVDFLRIKTDDANRIVDTLLGHSNTDVRIHSARVLSACFSNNPETRKIAKERGYLSKVLAHLNQEQNPKVQGSMIFTLGTLLRGDLEMIQHLHLKPISSDIAKSRSKVTGIDVLSKVFATASRDDRDGRKALRIRILRLFFDLMDPSIIPSIKDDKKAASAKLIKKVNDMTLKSLTQRSRPYCKYVSSVIAKAPKAQDDDDFVDDEVDASQKLWSLIFSGCLS
ncbi:nucleotide exchange factor sil1 [Phlyctochytrium planicorne]|nr:nucleotide exchange factor sil1 [Phlyctochytrium planicorne]